MNIERLQVENKDGKKLSTHIDFPNHQKPKQFALFAHCFTCSSQLNAVRNISRALNAQGIAVVRFDFTGLGNSEGEFANSHFEANVEDLIAVNQFIVEHYQAPTLIIGHSLGGAAAIVAASKLDNLKAVCTIGTPSDVRKTTRYFASQIDDTANEEDIPVTIGGRPFVISRSFVEGFQKHHLPEVIKSLRKPILVMHAPQDETVDISNAHDIYHNAMHPKSFLSLDTADHLLTRKEDSLYAGAMIAAWAARYIDLTPAPTPDPESHQIVGHLNLVENNFTTSINSRNHGIIADEPKSVGGDDFGMAPYELVSAGLAACTVMTLKLYAQRKKWDLQEVFAYVSHGRDRSGEKPVDVFSKSLEFVGDLDEAQKERLREIAGRCPVHRTLQQASNIQTVLKNG